MKHSYIIKYNIVDGSTGLLKEDFKLIKTNDKTFYDLLKEQIDEAFKQTGKDKFNEILEVLELNDRELMIVDFIVNSFRKKLR